MKPDPAIFVSDLLGRPKNIWILRIRICNTDLNKANWFQLWRLNGAAGGLVGCEGRGEHAQGEGHLLVGEEAGEGLLRGRHD